MKQVLKMNCAKHGEVEAFGPNLNGRFYCNVCINEGIKEGTSDPDLVNAIKAMSMGARVPSPEPCPICAAREKPEKFQVRFFMMRDYETLALWNSVIDRAREWRRAQLALVHEPVTSTAMKRVEDSIDALAAAVDAYEKEVKS